MSYTKQHAGMILVGPLADRPAASVGEYWYLATDEDGGTLYHSNATTWTQVAAGVSATGGGPPTGSAGGALDGSYPNPGLASSVAGNGLAESSDVLSVNVDGSTIEISSDSLRVKASGITANEIATDAVGSSEIASGAVGTAELASSVLLGSIELVYRYTVAGSDKTSIDTGVDTADAGTNDWTNGDVLEIWITHKTDTVAETDTINVTVNNDTNNNYDRQVLSGANATVAAASVQAAANWNLGSKGSGDNYAVVSKLVFPAYNNTSFYKIGEGSAMRPDDTAGTNAAVVYGLAYRSTTALSRLKVIPNTGGAKLKVGSQLLIYKRRSA